MVPPEAPEALGGGSVPTRVELVDRYLDAIEAFDKAAAMAILHPDVTVTLHPNLFAPNGSVRVLNELAAAFDVGRGILQWQRFAERAHTAIDATVILTRTVWSGRTAQDLPGLVQGTSLKADVASLVTFEGDRIVRQENFDCYYPPEPPPTADHAR
jgi:ketosteroid isomerase-like protein